MSLPNDNPFRDQQHPPASSSHPRFSRWVSVRRTIYLFLLILVGPCLLAEVPQEIGRWKLASALQLREAGQKDQAYQALEEALRRFPRNPLLLLQRADWRLEDGEKDKAQQDWNQLLESPRDSDYLLKLHSQILQNAGQFAEAVGDWEQLNVLSERSGRPGRAEALNGLAYARALAQSDLEEALKNVNAALELSPDNPSMLDTRGYLLYLTKKYQAALPDMNVAVREFEKLATGQSSVKSSIVQFGAHHQRLLNSYPKSAREAAGASDVLRGVAVVRYHRALVLLALGREKDAEEDLTRVRQLIGKEPDETLF